MEAVFLKILNMSLTATWLALAVMVLRPLLKKAPKWISVAMWALVGIRLICPFSVESMFSLTPDTETVVADFVYAQRDIATIDQIFAHEAMDPVISQLQNPEIMTNPTLRLEFWAAVVWLSGVAVMLLYSLLSYLLLRRKVRVSLRQTENIYFCDSVETPFILGMLRPKIYLPSGMDPSQIAYVTAHEKAHLKRKDHWWKPLGFALLALHWFNPVLWVAYVLLCRDIELACDEKVVKHADDSYRVGYSRALVDCSIRRKNIMACPLAFGEVGVKARIKSVLHYKKPTIWIILAAVLLCTVVAVCLLTDPVRSVDAKMEVFIDYQIAEHHQSEKSAGHACVLDWQVLGKEKKGNKTTVYLWVLYEEYALVGGKPELQTGSHIPTVITAEKKDGQYFPVEYWEPRDGTYYEPDIREKFPWYLESKALDSQRYIDKQQAACEDLVEEHYEELPLVDEMKALELPMMSHNSKGSIRSDRQHIYQTYSWSYLGKSDWYTPAYSSTQETKRQVDMYLLVLEMRYNIMADKVEEHSGKWYPTIVTLEWKDGGYHFAEYWSSDDEAEVRERFPKDMADKAYSEEEATVLLEACLKDAIAYAAGEVVAPVLEQDAEARTQSSAIADAMLTRYPRNRDQVTGTGSEKQYHTTTWSRLGGEYISGTALEGQGKHKELYVAYLSVLQSSYVMENGEVKEVARRVIPTKVTFAIDEYGNYWETDYWESDDETLVYKTFPQKMAQEAYAEIRQDDMANICYWSAVSFFENEANEDGSLLSQPLIVVDNKTGEVLAATSIPEEKVPDALRKAAEEIRNNS